MENLTINTPEGRASYPHVTNPDNYMGKEKYKLKLILDPQKPEVQDFMDQVTGFVEAAKAEASAGLKEELAGLDPASKNPKTIKQIKTITGQLEDIDTDYRSPLTEEYDRDTDEPTGNVIFDMKSNASFVNKKTKETIKLVPRLWDANGDPIRGERPDIKGGSRLSAKTTLHAYAAGFGCGTSARLGDVQVIRLAQGGGGAEGGAGFGKVAGGFVQEAPAFAPAASSGSDDSSMDY